MVNAMAGVGFFWGQEVTQEAYPYPARIEGLTLNQVAKQLGITRDEVNSMVGVVERVAGRKLPTRLDAQGNEQRYVAQEQLLPHFELAALLMRTDNLPPTQAMEAALGVNLPKLLERLTALVKDYYAVSTMHRTLQRATDELVMAAKTPHTYKVAIADSDAIQHALATLQQQIRWWQFAALLLAVSVLVCLLLTMKK